MAAFILMFGMFVSRFCRIGQSNSLSLCQVNIKYMLSTHQADVKHTSNTI